MNLNVAVPDFKNLEGLLTTNLAEAFTATTRKVTRQTEKELEAITVASGLSKRISRTWQSKTYPETRPSLNPAGVIWMLYVLPGYQGCGAGSAGCAAGASATSPLPTSHPMS